MDIIAEIVGELFGAVVEGLMYDRHIPKPIRVAVTTLLFGFATAIIVLVAVLADILLVSIICGVLAVIFLRGYIITLKKVLSINKS